MKKQNALSIILVPAFAIVATQLLTFPAYGMLNCTMDGQKINPNNGAETKGKTGRLKCVDADTKKLMSENEYKDGVQIGYRMNMTFNGEKTEQTVNERGNSIGVVKKYDKDGHLISEENYGPGKNPGWTTQQGTSKLFFSSGKLKHLTWYEKGVTKFSIAYREDGKITQLSCGDKSYMSEDKDFCGFSGNASHVDIYNPGGDKVVKTLSFLNGKPQEITLLVDGKVTEKRQTSGNDLKKTEFFENGKPKIEAQYHNHALDGDEKEYHQSGKMIRLTHWNQGQMESEKTYYLNGQQKSDVERKKLKNTYYIARKLFWDNGNIQEEGMYAEKTERSHWMDFDLYRWTYEMEVGPHHGASEDGKNTWSENYNDQGKLDGVRTSMTDGKKMEEQYKDGVLSHRKEWDVNKQLVVDDEFYEDGSHASHIKPQGQGI